MNKYKLEQWLLEQQNQENRDRNDAIDRNSDYDRTAHTHRYNAFLEVRQRISSGYFDE